MNIDLMRIVEQVVRPLPALKVNKLRMREELYAQLEQIYTEELCRDGATEVAARQRASARFGDPELLRAELLQTIPPSERAWAIADRMLVRRREGEGLFRFSLRIGLHAGLGMVLFGMFLFAIAALPFSDPPKPSFWGWRALATVTVGVNSFCLTLLGNAALAEFQWDEGHARLRRAFRFILWSLVSGLLVAISEVLNLFYLVGIHWKLGYAEPLFCVWLIAGAMFAVVVWLRVREDARFQPWAQVSLTQQQPSKRGMA